MGFLDRVNQGISWARGSNEGTFMEQRSTNPENPSTPWDVVATAWESQMGTSTGVNVNEDNALKYSVVFACVRVISETLASVPLCIHRERPNGTTIEAKTYPLYKTLKYQANPLMNSFVWREVSLAHLLLWGNAYSRIEERPDGSIYLWPLQPMYMTVDGSTGKLLYRYRAFNKEEQIYRPDEILHVKGLGLDGIAGQGVIQLARESVGMGMAMEKYGGAWFGNGARPGGVIEVPIPLEDKARQNLRKGFETRHMGVDNAHRVAVLEMGATYKPIAMSPSDSQFLESRNFQIEEMCRWFRVPPRKVMHIVGGNGDTSGIEEQGIEFVTDAIQPWAYRIEAAIKERLLGPESSYYAEFDLDGLMRGNLTARYQSYALGIQWGFLTANDARKAEHMPPIEGGDMRLLPINMTTPEGMEKSVDQIGKTPPPGGSPPNPGTNGPSATAPGTQPPMSPANQNPRSLTLIDECKGVMRVLTASQGDLLRTATAFYENPLEMASGVGRTREAVVAAIEKGGDREKILARVSGVLGNMRQKEVEE